MSRIRINGSIVVLTVILISGLIYGLWWSLKAREEENLHRAVQVQAEKLAAFIDADLRARLPALRRVVDRWRWSDGMAEKGFMADAGNLFRHMPGFQALARVDGSFHIRWVHPLEGNESLSGYDLLSEEISRPALERARQGRKPIMRPAIELPLAERGFLVYFPIHADGGFQGFLLAVFDVKTWLNYVFSLDDRGNDRHGFGVSVDIDHVPVFSRYEPVYSRSNPNGPNRTYRKVSRVRVLEHDIRILVWPRPKFIEASRSPLPVVAVVSATILSLLTLSMAWLFQGKWSLSATVGGFSSRPQPYPDFIG